MTNVPSKKYRQKSAFPTRKVRFGSLAGAISLIIVWLVNIFHLLPGGVAVPGEIAVAFTTILTFSLSYSVSPSSDDQVILQDDKN